MRDFLATTRYWKDHPEVKETQEQIVFAKRKMLSTKSAKAKLFRARHRVGDGQC